MTRTTMTLLVLVCVAGGCGTEMSRPDFSGTWVLDLSRSSLEIMIPDSSIFVIDHREPILIGERTHFLDGVSNTSSGSEATTDSVLTVLQAGDLEIQTRVYWDGQTLVLAQEWSQGGVPVTNLVRYTLADEGQTLIADERMSAGDDDHHNVWTFRRR